MRERTPITKNLIDNLNDLKYIITSGSRNKAIDLAAAKKRKIIVCGTEIGFSGTSELTWGLILGLARILKKKLIICIKVTGNQLLALNLKEKF